MNADRNGNYNWDITIRDIKESDIYDGIIVQSYGNSNTIYKLFKYRNVWTYIPIGEIIDRKQNYKDSDITNLEYSNIYQQRARSSAGAPASGIKWVETIYSRRMNLKFIREEKLKLLGI